MDQSNRREVKARSSMLNVKHNFRNVNQGTKQRIYGTEKETREHALETYTLRWKVPT